MTHRVASAPDDAIERERRLWLSYQSRDRSRIEDLVAVDAIDIGPGGVLTREDVISAVSQMIIESFDLEDFRVLNLGKDVEVVTYRSRVMGTYQGKPFSHDVVRSTSVWSRSGSSWQMVHRVECPEAHVTNQEPVD